MVSRCKYDIWPTGSLCITHNMILARAADLSTLQSSDAIVARALWRNDVRSNEQRDVICEADDKELTTSRCARGHRSSGTQSPVKYYSNAGTKCFYTRAECSWHKGSCTGKGRIPNDRKIFEYVKDAIAVMSTIHQPQALSGISWVPKFVLSNRNEESPLMNRVRCTSQTPGPKL